MLSGRFPNHITSVQPDGGNLCSDFLPLATTLLSEKLTSAGCEYSPLFSLHLCALASRQAERRNVMPRVADVSHFVGKGREFKRVAQFPTQV